MPFLILLLIAAQSAGVEPTPAKSPAETLKELQAVYASTCGERGIQYHAYDELCDDLRKQMKLYQRQVDKAGPPPPPKP